MSSNGTTPVPGDDRPRVSLITTIRDEADQLPELLESIRLQSLQPDAVVVVDGGSTDRILEVLEQWKDRLPLEVYQCPGANISTGRNVAISQCRSDIIAVTDAGVRLDPNWLEYLVSPFVECPGEVDVVSGFFNSDSRDEFEAALAATTLPDVDEVEPGSFLPSSRSVAFRRSWFEAGIQYPEWLDYCEDLIFDLRLRRAGARFRFQPNALVYFRPRSSMRAFWSQYYRYARGDGKSGLFLKRHAVRYLTYLLVLPSSVVVRSPWWRAIVMLGAAAYMRKPVQRLMHREQRPLRRLIPLIGMSALLRGFGDVAKMAGYPVGLIWRQRRYGLRRDWRSIPEPGRIPFDQVRPRPRS
ncbi:MAG: glycosyltransferase, partial [Chloroflexota bacterium]